MRKPQLQPQPIAKLLPPCPLCGGKRVACPCFGIKIGDANYTVVKIRKHGGSDATTVLAWACSECGYLEMRAQQPEFLR